MMFPGKEISSDWDSARNLKISVPGITPAQQTNLEKLLRENVHNGIFQPPPQPILTPPAFALRRHLYLDGLRYSVNMASLAYTRLRSVLTSISDTRNPGPTGFTSAFLDAWSIVDSISRYQKILRSLPGLKCHDPSIKVFLAKTKPLNDIRNYMQHPDTTDHFQKLEKGTRPFLGILVWTRVYSLVSARVCSLVAGSLPYQKAIVPSVNPVGQTLDAPVDLVHLHVGPSNVSLSELLRILMNNYAEIPQQTEVKTLADVFVSVDITPAGNEVKDCDRISPSDVLDFSFNQESPDTKDRQPNVETMG